MLEALGEVELEQGVLGEDGDGPEHEGQEKVHVDTVPDAAKFPAKRTGAPQPDYLGTMQGSYSELNWGSGRNPKLVLGGH